MDDAGRNMALEAKEKRMRNLTNAGKGRPPGCKNKITQDMKKAFMEAFDELGGIDGLVTWGRRNRGRFYALTAKMMGTQRDHATTQQVMVQIIGRVGEPEK